MNSGNVKTSDPCRLVLNLADIQSNRYIALSNLSIH